MSLSEHECTHHGADDQIVVFPRVANENETAETSQNDEEACLRDAGQYTSLRIPKQPGRSSLTSHDRHHNSGGKEPILSLLILPIRTQIHHWGLKGLVTQAVE